MLVRHRNNGAYFRPCVFELEILPESYLSQVDSSFHSPEWHAARLESLKTSHTITWEEYKKKQKVICRAMHFWAFFSCLFFDLRSSYILLSFFVIPFPLVLKGPVRLVFDAPIWPLAC